MPANREMLIQFLPATVGMKGGVIQILSTHAKQQVLETGCLLDSVLQKQAPSDSRRSPAPATTRTWQVERRGAQQAVQLAKGHGGAGESDCADEGAQQGGGHLDAARVTPRRQAGCTRAGQGRSLASRLPLGLGSKPSTRLQEPCISASMRCQVPRTHLPPGRSRRRLRCRRRCSCSARCTPQPGPPASGKRPPAQERWAGG